jgi:hypothetical protein
MLKSLLIKVVNRFRNTDKEELNLVKLENEQSLIFTKDSVFHENIESALKTTVLKGGRFGGWALSLSSLRYFCYYLLNKIPEINIIELGGGQSTLFWNNLINTQNKCLIKVSTFEHNKSWANKLKKIAKNVNVMFFNLKQLSEDEFNLIISHPAELIKTWDSLGTKVSGTEEINTRIKNSFYNVPLTDLPAENSIDGLIVDGPHGNGRSISFPLFYNSLKINSIILIDDYDHYPFLENLGYLYNYEILQKSQTKIKKWILVKITEKY